MTISDSILRPRVPSVGTITTGRGVSRTSQQGREYSQPTRESTLVLHTNDGELANAVQEAHGGSVYQDSPTWDYDVVTDATQLEVTLLPGLFRQNLESWRAAQCLRRCDGERMSMLQGQPVDRPCLCADEIRAGAERTCAPHTVMPVLLDLPVERVGTWEVKSTAWGTAANLAGTLRLLLATGYTGEVPAILTVQQRTLRDRSDTVREVPELTVVPAVSLQALASGRVAALPGQTPPALDAPEDRVLAALQDTWQTLWERAGRLGLTAKGEPAHAWWQHHHPGTHWQDLGAADLRAAVDALRDLVEQADAAVQDRDTDANDIPPNVTPAQAREDAPGAPEPSGGGEATDEPPPPQEDPAAEADGAWEDEPPEDTGADGAPGELEACAGCGATAPADATPDCDVCMGWGPTPGDSQPPAADEV